MKIFWSVLFFSLFSANLISSEGVELSPLTTRLAVFREVVLPQSSIEKNLIVLEKSGFDCSQTGSRRQKYQCVKGDISFVASSNGIGKTKIFANCGFLDEKCSGTVTARLKPIMDELKKITKDILVISQDLIFLRFESRKIMVTRYGWALK